MFSKYNYSTVKAAEYFKKLTYGSTYEKFYGEGKHVNLNAGEAEILKYKKLSELKLASHLNSIAVQYLENWT